MTQLITDRFGGVFYKGSGEMWCSSPGTVGCIQQSHKLLRCLNESENNCPSHPFSIVLPLPRAIIPVLQLFHLAFFFLSLKKIHTLPKEKGISLTFKFRTDWGQVCSQVAKEQSINLITGLSYLTQPISHSSGHHPKESDIKSSRDIIGDIEALLVFMHCGDIQVIHY